MEPHPANSFGRRDQVDEPHAPRIEFREQIQRRHRAAARRQHRVDQNHFRLAQIGRQALVVEHRAQSRFLALQANETNSRMGHELENRIQHSQAGAQHRHEHNFAPQLIPARARQRRPDRSRLDRKGPGRLVEHQLGDLPQHAPEFLRAGPLVAQQRQVMLDQRVRDDRHAFHSSMSEHGRKKVELASLEFRRLHSPIEFHDFALALAENPEQVGNIEALFELH